MSTFTDELRKAADAFHMSKFAKRTQQIIDSCNEHASNGHYEFKQVVPATDAEIIKGQIEQTGLKVELLEGDRRTMWQPTLVVSWK